MTSLGTPSLPAPSTAAAPPPDLAAVKTRQQAMWGSGDYGHIGVRLQIVGETLCEAARVGAGDRVLDVAAGNGNASLAAARRSADVTSTDYVPALVEQARRRAEADRLPIAFEIADAEQLPYPDASFDVALSTFGVMFTPDPARAAAELARVVKPGGRIGLANWTPDGFIGQFFKVVVGFVPPPAGVPSPLAWGTEARLRELFAGRASAIRIERRFYAFRARSAAEWIELFRTYYGPTHKAFAALDADGRMALHGALSELLHRHNRSGRETIDVPSEYLEVVITR